MLLLGVIFSVCGFLLSRYPPKKINSIYGYRTRQSMSSQLKWDLAQVHSGKLMFRSGLLLTLIGVVFWFIPLSDGLEVIIGTSFLVIFCIVLFQSTE